MHCEIHPTKHSSTSNHDAKCWVCANDALRLRCLKPLWQPTQRQVEHHAHELHPTKNHQEQRQWQLLAKTTTTERKVSKGISFLLHHKRLAAQINLLTGFAVAPINNKTERCLALHNIAISRKKNRWEMFVFLSRLTATWWPRQ